MEKINFDTDKYNNLTNIDWTKHVGYATIKFNILTGNRQGSQIIIKHKVQDNMELYDSLVKDDVIIASDYTKRQLREGVQKQVQDKVNIRLSNRIRGIRIYNELAELDVKDTRRDNYSEHVVDGKVDLNEIKIVNRVDSLGSIVFNPTFHDCLYDYDVDAPRHERYVYKKTWAPNSISKECCSMEISFDINHVNHENNQRFYLPDVEVTAKYKEYYEWDKKLIDSEIDLISASCDNRSQLTFNSYRLQNSSRKVSLNMFMVYVRQTTKENIFKHKRDTSQQSNLDTQMDVLGARFPNEKIMLASVIRIRCELTHDYYNYWSRQAKECIKVWFEDESYILYNKELAQRESKLEVLGVYDSQHKYLKEDVAINKLINQNQ